MYTSHELNQLTSILVCCTFLDQLKSDVTKAQGVWKSVIGRERAAAPGRSRKKQEAKSEPDRIWIWFRRARDTASRSTASERPFSVLPREPWKTKSMCCE